MEAATRELALAKTLSAWPPSGSHRLHTLFLDRKTVAAYTERLNRLQEEYARQCRRAHAVWVTVIADRGLATICRDDLSAVGVLQPG